MVLYVGGNKATIKTSLTLPASIEENYHCWFTSRWPNLIIFFSIIIAMNFKAHILTIIINLLLSRYRNVIARNVIPVCGLPATLFIRCNVQDVTNLLWQILWSHFSAKYRQKGTKGKLFRIMIQHPTLQ